MEVNLIMVMILFKTVITENNANVNNGKRKSSETNVVIGSSTFRDILKSSAFLDRSMLIEKILEHRLALITAPRLFGKSANMDMLKTFFEIQVDEIPTDYDTRKMVQYLEEPVVGTANYRLFANLKIFQSPDIMNRHFGKYPVVFVDFNREDAIKSFDDAVEYIGKAIRKSFLEHEYLLHSGNLDEHDKTEYRIWCDTDGYKNISRTRIANGLKVLTHSLHQHFNKQCFVLIDGYDSIIAKIMFESVNDTAVLKRIMNFYLGVLGTVFEGSYHVSRGLITGISDIADNSRLKLLSNVESFKFLKSHSFTDFYGLTEEAFNDIFDNPIFGLDSSNLKEMARSHYDGYVSENGRKIYNLWSVLNFLRSKEIKNYWCQSESGHGLNNVFEIPAVKVEIKALLKDKCKHIMLKDKFYPEDVLKLKHLLGNPLQYDDVADIDILFSYLLDRGYLIIISKDSIFDTYDVKIPNEEIKTELAGKIK